MSQATDCGCACVTPEIVEIPGDQGEAGTNGTDGDNGINAFTVTTADFTIPTVGNDVIVSVGISSWAGVNQPIFISDPNGTDYASFTVVSIPNSTSIEITPLNYGNDAVNPTSLATGSTVSPSGTQPIGPIAVADGGTGSATATTARAALGIGGSSLTVYAAGTAYSMTNSAAAITFGTTSPALVITSPGVWLILARARVDYNGATFAASRTGTVKIRRTNNTAADQISTQFLTDIITTLTYTLADIVVPPLIYTTTNSDDALALYGDVGVVPSAGSLDVSEAEIVAVKLYDQTV